MNLKRKLKKLSNSELAEMTIFIKKEQERRQDLELAQAIENLKKAVKNVYLLNPDSYLGYVHIYNDNNSKCGCGYLNINDLYETVELL